MLIEIYECDRCGKKLLWVGSRNVSAHHCSGSQKFVAEVEVSPVRLKKVISELTEYAERNP